MLCKIQGHEEFQQDNICVLPNCYYSSRLMCQKCIESQEHKHDEILEIIKVELFFEYFNEHTLAQLESRLQSQNGYQYKYIYLQKICTEFSMIQSTFTKFQQILQYQKHELNELRVKAQKLQKIKQIISNLIDSYRAELLKIQQIEKAYQKLKLTGVFSLDEVELNNLLDYHRYFFNEEIHLYQNLNRKLDKFSDIICKYSNDDLHQSLIENCKKLQKINDFIDFQQSINFNQEWFLNRSFFSKNDKFFAMISKDNKLKIRNQRNFKMIQNIKFNYRIDLIEFDLLFKYFVVYARNRLSYYVVTQNMVFKMIKQFRYKNRVDELFLSSLNKKIMFNKIYNKDSQLQKQLCQQNNYWFKGQNLLWKPQKYYAIHSSNDQVIQFFIDIQNTPFIIIRNFKIDEMIFIDNDIKLLTQNQWNVSLWQIDYQNEQTILLNEIAKDLHKDRRWYIINQTEFHIIKYTIKGRFEIFDKNFKLYLRFSDKNIYLRKMVHLTKNFIIFNVGWDIDWQSKLIKRQVSTDYELLEL